MRFLVRCRALTLNRLSHNLVNLRDFTKENTLDIRFRSSPRLGRPFLTVPEIGWLWWFDKRLFCTSDNGDKQTLTGKSSDGSIEKWCRLPRRLIKRLKKQGISESQFIARLNAGERNSENSHIRSIDRYNNSSSHEQIEFTGSQKELEDLIKDMSLGAKHVSGLEPFPSDMIKQKDIIKKQRKSSHGNLEIEPSSTSILLFPGQGSQFVNMGKKLLYFPGVNELYEEASSILGYDLLKLCLKGPKSELDKTIYCQPAVMITSIAALEKLREDHPDAIENCVATAGFSVGEFAALVFSGVMSFPDAVEVVKIRAEAMQKASERVGSGMLSVFLAHNSDLKSALKMAKEYCMERRGIEDPVCQVANYLFPECKVVAGHLEALDFISANAKEFRLLRTKHLPVSGAFHTQLMNPAVSRLENVLKKMKFGDPKLPVYSNLSGLPYYQKANFSHKLCQHMVKPVKWEQIMHSIYTRPQGVDFPKTFELGPSRQMGTLLKQINLAAYKSYHSVEV